MQYQIQEPTHELTDGYFTLGLKLSVLTLIGWMVGIIAVCTYPCLAWNGDKYPPTLVFLNDYYILHLIASGIIIYFFSKSQFKKYKQGLITDFEFNGKDQVLNLIIINTLNGTPKKVSIPYSNLKIKKEIKKGKVMGEQTIYHFYKKEELITSFNVLLTPWKKHEEFSELIDRLEQKVTD